MKVNGSATVAAPPQRVWNALVDPAVLVRTIPGCSRLEEVGADSYAMTVSAGVASVKGSYAGEVALAEPDPPNSFVLRARGQGAPGTVEATVLVRLSPGEDGGTRVDYEADAVVGGMIGGVGQRMLGTVARRTAGEFFAAVERTLTETPEPAAVPTAVPGAVPGAVPAEAPVHPAGTVYTAPPPQQRQGDGRPGVAWAMTSAFTAGGAVALAGVAIGYLLGRRRGR